MMGALIAVVVGLHLAHIEKEIVAPEADLTTPVVKTHITPMDEQEVSRPEVPIKKGVTLAPAYLRLVGVLANEKKGDNVASIKNLLTHQVHHVKQGQFVGDWEVAQIHLGTVSLKKNDRLCELQLASGSEEEMITMLSPTQRVVDRDILSRYVGNLNEALKALTFIPHFENGRLNGIKLIAIRDDKLKSLAQKAGVEVGDIIQSVNGHMVDGLGSLLAMYQDIHIGSQVKVEIKRAGTSKQLSYYIN